jgi:hypothetical protein
MHSWDLAQATGQEFAADPRILEALIEFLAQAPADGSPGMFRARVEVDDEATLLEQALGLAGRDPSWQRTGRRRRAGVIARPPAQRRPKDAASETASDAARAG